MTLTDLPDPFQDCNGTILWVGEPRDISEHAGSSDGSPPNFKGAGLTTEPVFRDWGAAGLVHVFDDEVVPNATYTFEVIDHNCELGSQADYSEPLLVTTSKWGDLVGDCTMTPCSPPDGFTNFGDISAVVDKFRNLPTAIIKARADIAPGFPDSIVNFIDIPAAVDAFRGLPYPYDWPTVCP